MRSRGAWLRIWWVRLAMNGCPLYLTINSGSPIDEAVPVVYNLALEELESGWRADVIRAMSLLSRSNIGAIGVSALITVVIAVALATSSLG